MKKNRIISAVSALALVTSSLCAVSLTASAEDGWDSCIIPEEFTQEQAKERLYDEYYSYKYIFFADESGFLLKECADRITESPLNLPYENDRVFFIPRTLYEKSKTEEMKEWEVGDIVMYAGDTAPTNFNYPMTVQMTYSNAKLDMFNFGAYSDITGEDLQPQIDNAYDTFLKTMNEGKVPDPVTSYDELVALRFPDNPQYQCENTDVKFGGNRLNAYQNDHIYYVEGYIDSLKNFGTDGGCYVLRQLDRKYGIKDYYFDDNFNLKIKDDATSALVIDNTHCTYLDETTLDLIPKDSFDSFEIGDIIYVNYSTSKSTLLRDGMIQNEHYSSLRKLCTFKDLAENSANIELSSTVIKSDETNLGDANCDGNVNIADAVLVQQFIVNPDKYTLSEQGKLNADVFNTGDGVTMADALEIQLMIANS